MPALQSIKDPYYSTAESFSNDLSPNAGTHWCSHSTMRRWPCQASLDVGATVYNTSSASERPRAQSLSVMQALDPVPTPSGVHRNDCCAVNSWTHLCPMPYVFFPSHPACAVPATAPAGLAPNPWETPPCSPGTTRQHTGLTAAVAAGFGPGRSFAGALLALVLSVQLSAPGARSSWDATSNHSTTPPRLPPFLPIFKCLGLPQTLLQTQLPQPGPT